MPNRTIARPVSPCRANLWAKPRLKMPTELEMFEGIRQDKVCTAHHKGGHINDVCSTIVTLQNDADVNAQNLKVCANAPCSQT